MSRLQLCAAAATLAAVLQGTTGSSRTYSSISVLTGGDEQAAVAGRHDHPVAATP
jgi:hypothetical protein